MIVLQVDTFVVTFAPSVAAAQIYDTWKHYTQVRNAPGMQQKAVDVVAVEGVFPLFTLWLIEAKDFRVITNPPRPSNLGKLAETVASKARDTLSGLKDAAIHAADASERDHAANAITATSVRIVLHLEPHVGPHTALFPANFTASVFQKLRQLVKSIDPNPLVLSIANTSASGVPWSVV